MNKKHIVPVAVLTAFPCLLLAANASTTSRPGADAQGEKRTKTEEQVVPPLIAWTDFDGDGRADAFAVHPDGTGVLYRGTDEGGLALVVEDLGLSSLPSLRSVAWEDANSDGLPDLLVVLAAGGAQLFVNDGAGFADSTADSGLELDGVLAARWSDHDSDGAPDLVTSTATGYRVHRNLGGGFFASVALEAPVTGEHTAPSGVVANTHAESPRTGPAGPRSAPSAPAKSSDSAGGGRRPVLPADVSLAGGTQKLVGPPTVFDARPIPSCAASIEDQASTSCLNASSTPTLGMLYPLSTDLNVAANGRVGMGTTNPNSKLEILALGGERALEARAGGDVTAAYLFSSGVIEPTLEVVSSGSFAGAFSGRVEQGYQAGFPLFNFRPRVVLDSEDNGHGRVIVRDDAGRDAVTLRANGTGTFGSRLEMLNGAGTETVRLGSTNGASAGFLQLEQSTGIQTVELAANDFQTPGAGLILNTSAGTRTVEFLSEEGSGNGAQLTLGMADGTSTIVLDAELGTVSADLGMYTSAGVKTVELRPEEVAGNGAQLLLRKADGSTGIVLDAEQNGDARITTEVLEITGGADLVESFDTGDVVCAPGSVVVIDHNRPGELTLSSQAYDVRVAGVVSGAGGVRAGLHMGQTGVATGDTPVALTGRVHVLCTSEGGAIQPGDLLTSSSTVGHAMRATDRERSFGTVIGKAMTALAEGETGLVLVLVNLQ